jgi:NAD(P)H dehydrogenase (quinone)
LPSWPHRRRSAPSRPGANTSRTADVAEASVDDLAWADAVLFGTPTRFGNVASQLKAFIDTTGPLWAQGGLADKVYSAFTASNTAHGGQEATLLALGNVFYHWGGIIVPPGYTDPVQFQSGNPYGTSHVAGDGPPSDLALQAARYQARRAVDTAASLKAGRAA